jgi:phytoene dehydrogenase-like protein
MEAHVMAAASYDAIIIGAGHNGLIAGAYLARAGKKVLVLERRDIVGGAAVTEEIFPGYRFTEFSYVVSLLRPEIIRDLELPKHGLKILPLPSTVTPLDNGDYLAGTTTTSRAASSTGTRPATPRPPTSIRVSWRVPPRRSSRCSASCRPIRRR